MGRPPSYDHDVLLQEIIECLWERGYAATPISALVQETGVNAPSLYARFGSKKGIMLAALEAYGQQTAAGIEGLLASVPPGAAQVRAVLDHAMESFDDPRRRGCFLVNSIMSIAEDMPEFTEAVEGHMARIRGLLRDGLAAAPGLRPGITPEEAALFVQMQVWAIKLMARMHPSREMGEAVVRRTLVSLFDEATAAAFAGVGRKGE